MFLFTTASYSQVNQLNIFSGYSLLSNVGTNGASVGFGYSRILDEKLKLGFTISGFYGNTDRFDFPNSETYRYHIMEVSKVSLEGVKSQYPLLTEEIKKQFEEYGLIPLDRRIQRHFYLPSVISLSYYKRFLNKHEISLNAGLGITYYHAKSLFMGVEGGEVIESERPEMIGKDVSFIFERYYRTFFVTYSYGIDYNYYFNEKSYLGLSIRVNSRFKTIETLGQFNFNVGTNF